MKEISIRVENPFLRPLLIDLKSSSVESDDFALINCLGMEFMYFHFVSSCEKLC